MEQTPLVISCEECALDRTTACRDCVVSYVLDHDPGDAIIIDAAEARAVRLLAGGGLIPGLRRTRAGSADRLATTGRLARGTSW